MWPRTPEERARNRHTGFVCFMNRSDAEDAMACCNDKDPFNVGRALVMRWGKNVRKAMNIVPIQKRSVEPKASSRQPVFDPARDGSNAISVSIPSSKSRAMFISLVASYVAKDGSAFEQLLQQEANPQYSFMRLPPNPTPTQRDEHIYYRWRVYSFAQGDGFFVWRTEPFCMFRPYGCFWIPPPLDANAAEKEVEHKRQEEKLRQQKQERSNRRKYVTGRQLERARKGGVDGGGKLTPQEMKDFEILFRQKLCASRESICEAMAFCFEKSGAAKQIADLIKELLLEENIGVDTRICRLYLLSDILFNSQQPGVKNAFLYRDAVERNAPEIFASLGKGSDLAIGRLSRNKLASAVSRVLAAWTSWSVYPPFFLDQLQDLFEGKEITITDDTENGDLPNEEEKIDDANAQNVIAPNDADFVSTRRKGEWTDINDETENHDDDDAIGTKVTKKSSDIGRKNLSDGAARTDGQKLITVDKKYIRCTINSSEKSSKGNEKFTRSDSETFDVRNEEIAADEEMIDPDGEPIDVDEGNFDPDGEPIDPDGGLVDAAVDDGEPFDPDGEPLDPDGEPVGPDGEGMDPDGEPLDLDGEPMGPDGESFDPDGEQIDQIGQHADDSGEPFDPDGEPIT